MSTIRQYLQARLIDEMHVAIGPVMLGKGEHLFGGIDTLALGYVCTKHVASPNATHFVLTRQSGRFAVIALLLNAWRLTGGGHEPFT